MHVTHCMEDNSTKLVARETAAAAAATGKQEEEGHTSIILHALEFHIWVLELEVVAEQFGHDVAGYKPLSLS